MEGARIPYQGLRTVVIAEPDQITPTPSPGLAPVDSDNVHHPPSPKQYRTNTSRRLSGRPADKSSPSLHSIPSLSSLRSIPAIDLPGVDHSNEPEQSSNHQPQSSRDTAGHILSQVAHWLQQEKVRRASHRSRRHDVHGRLVHAADTASAFADHFRTEESKHRTHHHARRDSDLSDGASALEKLEQILSQSMNLGYGKITPGEDTRDSYFARRKSLRKGSKNLTRRQSTSRSSDSEHPDNELLVPSAEVVLDNSKTCGYTGGAAESEVDLRHPSKRTAKEKEAWRRLKSEIVTLTHTLKISGWRRVPIEQSSDIDVERLSGAMTNAVYVVSPPKTLPQTPAVVQADAAPVAPKRPPPKLLLRIYGPQVEHLIDREGELQILRRLARKKIGPRLLGTFANGRFEQYFYAKTLTAADLRNPETSKQIAKRMRELHDGIDLLKEEREGGPFTWKNWDKWVDRCEEVTTWLDQQISSQPPDQINPRSKDWKKRGLVCGVKWPIFRRTVERYRAHVISQYHPPQSLFASLVFAHNDTQYGNLLRLSPSGESPLLLPANEHKQLVVIDFEYASANPRGLEFANHFTEWCYNYHHPATGHALNEKAYPTPDEQHRFLKAYIQHRPPPTPTPTSTTNTTNYNQPPPSRANSTASLPPLSPLSSPHPGPTSTSSTSTSTNTSTASISTFRLDSRAPPPPGGYAEEERQRDRALAAEIEQLRKEIRLWRVANSAQWIAWGIVQAEVPGLDEGCGGEDGETEGGKSEDKEDDQAHTPMTAAAVPDSDPLSSEMQEKADAARDKRPEERVIEGEAVAGEEEEFDYLGYAQQRALFFWGDVLQLGLISLEELPVEMRGRVKVVEY